MFEYRVKQSLVAVSLSLLLLACSEKDRENFLGEPPDAPTGLNADASPTLRAILLSWHDNSSREKRYIVQRRADSQRSFHTIVKLRANSTSYTDSGVLAGVRYTYRVMAARHGKRSDASNSASATWTLSAAIAARPPFTVFPQSVSVSPAEALSATRRISLGECDCGAPGKLDSIATRASGEAVDGESDGAIVVCAPPLAFLERTLADGVNPLVVESDDEQTLRIDIGTDALEELAFHGPSLPVDVADGAGERLLGYVLPIGVRARGGYVILAADDDGVVRAVIAGRLAKVGEAELLVVRLPEEKIEIPLGDPSRCWWARVVAE